MIFHVLRRSVEKYLHESRQNLNFSVEVQNTGEDAFETMFYIHLPNGIHFKKAIDTDSTQTRILCSPVPTNNTIYGCDIGNPLPAGRVVSIYLQQKKLENSIFALFEFRFDL